MKWSFATVGIIILGIIGIMVIILFQDLTTNDENDYYLLKEVTEAAMLDSVDLKYYRETGDYKIVKEKFVENFTRRFAESTLFVGSTYTIKFFDIMEIPPKVTVTIDTGIGSYTIYKESDSYGINNELSAILEGVGKGKKNINGDSYDYYFLNCPGINGNESTMTLDIPIPDKLKSARYKNVERFCKDDCSEKIESIAPINSNIDDFLFGILKAQAQWNIDYSNIKNKIDIYDINNYTKGSDITIDKDKLTTNIPAEGGKCSLYKFDVKWQYDYYEE